MNWWEDKKIINGDKLEYRAILQDNKKIIKNLNGDWDFKYFKDVTLSITNDEIDIFNQKKWDKIPVPGCWEMNGFGEPNYLNTKHLFPHDVPRINCENPTGIYQKEIIIKPDEIKNNKAILRLHGIDSIAKIFINDKFVAINKNARVTSEFEITNFIKVGKNKIQLIVVKYSDLSYIEDQDMWRFGGIFRDVEMVFESENGIRDVYVTTDTNHKNHSAKLITNIFPYKNLKGALTISKNKEKISTQEFDTLVSKTIVIPMKDIKLWSADDPELYDINIKTKFNDIKIKIGFKNLEIKDRKMMINGVPIKLRGVNMHDFTPTKGRVMFKKDMLKNLKIMKAHNINAIRTSHYPKSHWFYEQCNEIGIWVMDEADVEAHGSERIGNWNFFPNDPTYAKHHVIKAKQMVLRDRNNVSILSYSLGNESGWGKGFKDMAMFIRKVTSKSDAFIHYEGDYEAELMDVHSSMYPELEDTKNLIKIEQGVEGAKLGGKTLAHFKEGILLGEKFEGIATKPHVECEYLHAMGNSAGSLKDYWDFYNANDSFMGGFIWEWFDQGLRVKGRKDYLYGGDFKHVKNDSSFCIDGLIMPDLTPSPFLIETKAVYSPIEFNIDSKKKEIEIINRYNFAQVNKKANIILIIKDFNGIKLSEKELEIPSIKRFSSYKFKIPKQIKSSYIVEIVAKDIKGNEITSTSSKIGKYEISDHGNSKREVIISPSVTNIMGTNDSMSINGFDGSIEYRKNNRLIIKGNLLNFWRPMIDNDRLRNEWDWKDNHRLDMAISKLISIKDISTISQTIILVTTRNSTPTQPWGFETKIKYSFTKSGFSIEVDSKDKFNMKLAEKPFRDDYGNRFILKQYEVVPYYIPRIGFDFEVDKSYKSVSYLGLGPEENYPDSMTAAKYDFFKTDINGLWTNYVVPQENGNRQGVNKIELLNDKSKIVIESSKGIAFNYAKYSQRNIDSAKHRSDLKEATTNKLSINYVNGPLGSASCGPMPLFRYLLRPKSFKMKYTFKFK